MRKGEDFEVEIVRELAVIHAGTKPTKARLVRWNGGEPKLDIRTWWYGIDGDEHAGRGISIALDEVQKLADTLNEYLAGGNVEA